MRGGFLLGVLFVISSAAASAEEAISERLTKGATVEGITEYYLDNGLRILLIPDDSRPLVTVNLTLFVGSRHEGYGETGMAHLLEHMVFKGTPSHPNVPKALRDHGARFNGTTWVDRTNYFETMPASDENLEFGIQLEADRMVNSLIRREDLASEMTVVRNEFEAGENDPQSILSQRMMATAYEWHNYGKSTIGNRSDIERVPVDNLRAFYRKYYQPDNAMLVVAGQFEADKALQYIVEHFGKLPKPERALPNTYTEEPAQDGERVVVLRRVGKVGAVGAVYHIPAGPHSDYPAVQLLEDILTSAPSGRLYKALVETELANSLRGSAYPWHDPGVLEVLATCGPDTIERVRQVLIDTLENLSNQPVTQEEVDRARRKVLRQYEQLMAQSDRLAVQLSEWAAAGDWRLFLLHRDRLEEVTVEDVQRVAEQYISQSNRTVGLYYPAEQAVRASIPPTPKVSELVQDYQGRTDLAQGEAFDPTPANIQARVQRGQIGQGVQYAFLPKKTRGQMVNLRLSLHYSNPQALAPLAAAEEFLGAMLQRGTERYTRQQLQDELARLRAQVQVGNDKGELMLTVQVKRDNLLETLELVEQILRQPTFPKDEFEVLKRQLKERDQRGVTEPLALATTWIRRQLNPYPPGDVRYVPTIPESLERIDQVTRDQIKELYEKHLGGEHAELAVVGDFDPKATKDAITRILGGWKARTAYQRVSLTAIGDGKGQREVIETPDKANAVYMAGMLYPLSDDTPEFAPLLLGNYLLGAAPLASRLSNRVRGEEGLSYGIGSQTTASALDPRGSFYLYAITNPKNIGKVDAAVREEYDRFLEDGVSLSELQEGKKAYLQSLKVQRTNDGTLAGMLVENLQAGRDFAYYAELERRIDAVQPQAIQDVFKKFLPRQAWDIAEAGDFKKE